MLVSAEGWHCLPSACPEPRMGTWCWVAHARGGRAGCTVLFKLLKNGVNPDLHFPFVTCSRSGPALEVTVLRTRHVADGNAAAGPWKGFWGGVGWFFFSQPIQERISFYFLSRHFLQHVSG